MFQTAPLLLTLLVNHAAGAQEVSPPLQPWPGIKIYSSRKQNPPNRIFAAVVDLRNRKLHVRVARGGPDPDGKGRWQTTLMTPTSIAQRDRMDFVVNGDFFAIPKAKDAEGVLSPFRAKQFAAVIGPAVTDGKVWSTNSKARPCLVVRKNGLASIEEIARPVSKDWEVISGNVMLLNDGEIVPHQNKDRHPRTAVGLTEKGSKLVIVVVDGRKPGVATGMSYDELAEEMKELGCYKAINLDGGGSSVMAYREQTGLPFHLMNEPTDGHERPVASVLGIRVDRGTAKRIKKGKALRHLAPIRKLG